MDKIFIQIAAYRDPELLPTLDNCLKMARNPQRLRFGICWQKDSDEHLAGFENDPRFRIIPVDYRESKGVCWARHQIQKLFAGEKYTLQLDSHHRFVKDWDDILVSMYEDLKNVSHKPLITGYAPGYDPLSGQRSALRPSRLGFADFSGGGALRTAPIPLNEEVEKPFRARFFSGHFFFADGNICREVPYDPQLYFLGEEPSMAARAFTHGYDLFHPHRWVLWHEYHRPKKSKHWDDHLEPNKEWFKLDQKSLYRYRVLMGMQKGTIDFGIFGFGKARSFDDYQAYSGVCFAKQGIHKRLLQGKPPLMNSEPRKIMGLKDYYVPRFWQLRLPLEKPRIERLQAQLQVTLKSKTNEILFQKSYPYSTYRRFFKRDEFYFNCQFVSIQKPVKGFIEFLDLSGKSYRKLIAPVVA